MVEIVQSLKLHPLPSAAPYHILLGKTHTGHAPILLWGLLLMSSAVSTWCLHEPFAEPLVTSGLPHCYLSLCLSFLFTFWLTHQTLDSVFMSKRIEEGLKGQSLPSLSLTWGLGARLRKGGARWARTPALSTGSETALRSCLPTNGWLQPPPVFHFHTGALEIHLKRKLRKRNRSEWYILFSANPIAIKSGQTFISPVLRSSWNYHEPKSGEMVADCIRPWPGTMNWFF